MGGEITVESAAGKGTTFRFTARFGYDKSEPAPVSSALGEFRDKRVLVLDAHSNSLRITTEQLETWGMKPHPVRDVVAAVRELRSAAAAGQPFDLFIADAVRPESPGVKLASTIDTYPELASTRVVLLVSSPRRGEVDRYRHAAIRATLIKPVTARSLRVAVVHAFEDRTKLDAMTVPKDDGIPGQRALTVLVAEDNAVNQRLARLNLEGWGHTVIVANDGREAVDAFEKAEIDLILMDLQMPRLSGFEATSEIRKLEKLRGIRRTPILALSANVIKGVRDECTKSGMDGYVPKPVRQQELLGAMGGVVPNLFTDPSEAAAFLREHTPKTPLAPAPLQPAPPPQPAEKPERLPFDKDALTSNIGDDKALIAEVVTLCRDNDTPRLLSELSTALAKNDGIAISRAAHGLKGMVGAFHANEAWAAAKQLELSGRTGSADALRADADVLVNKLRPLIEALEDFAGIARKPVTWN
jgi:two-component system, sensor histidine kinase and response regulator